MMPKIHPAKNVGHVWLRNATKRSGTRATPANSHTSKLGNARIRRTAEKSASATSLIEGRTVRAVLTNSENRRPVVLAEVATLSCIGGEFTKSQIASLKRLAVRETYE